MEAAMTCPLPAPHPDTVPRCWGDPQHPAFPHGVEGWDRSCRWRDGSPNPVPLTAKGACMCASQPHPAAALPPAEGTGPQHEGHSLQREDTQADRVRRSQVPQHTSGSGVTQEGQQTGVLTAEADARRSHHSARSVGGNDSDGSPAGEAPRVSVPPSVASVYFPSSRLHSGDETTDAGGRRGPRGAQGAAPSKGGASHAPCRGVTPPHAAVRGVLCPHPHSGGCRRGTQRRAGGRCMSVPHRRESAARTFHRRPTC